MLKMSTEQYEQSRICNNCGYEEIRLLSELSAAFEETRVWEEPCPKCGSIDFSESSSMPGLSRSILSVWATNDGLSFLQQDEDLAIASRQHLELIRAGNDTCLTSCTMSFHSNKRVCNAYFYVGWALPTLPKPSEGAFR